MFESKLILRLGNFSNLTKFLHTASIDLKARPGTRAKREAKKKALKLKKVEVKKDFVPYKVRADKEKIGSYTPRLIRSDKLIDAIDNVYFTKHYLFKNYTVAEAAEMHRETHHPTQFNSTNESLLAFIELSMSANKKKSFIDPFQNVVLMPAPFLHTHNRTILAVCKDEETAQEAKDAGATEAFGPNFFRIAKSGEIEFKDYDHIICNTSLLPEFVNYRTLVKRKMPSVTNGTAGSNISDLVHKFVNGIQYKVTKDKYDHDYASCEVKIGTLEMSNDELESNLETVLLSIEQSKPKGREARVLTRVTIKCPPTMETFQIDHNKYFPQEEEHERFIATRN